MPDLAIEDRLAIEALVTEYAWVLDHRRWDQVARLMTDDVVLKIRGREIKPVVAADRVRRVDRPHLVADTSRIQTETGWQPQYDLARGLQTLWHNALGQGEGA